MKLISFLALAACALLGACSTGHRAVTEPVVPPARADAASISGYPLPPERLWTTDPVIYLGNLDARIDSHRQLLRTQSGAAHHAGLAGGLMQRYHILGRLADAEEALQQLDTALQLDPGSAETHLARAAALSGFHRFNEANQAIEHARAHGANGVTIARIERDLQVAQGRYDELAEDFARSREPVADFYELAHRADLRLLQGDLDGATLWYRSAQSLYTDVDPLPLAWLYCQQGIAYLRHQRVAEALPYFEAAHQRLPQFALATEHLAETEFGLGHLDRARELYQAVIAQTENPEFIAALATLEAQAGHASRSAELLSQARRGYKGLLERHHAAYAQHAAEFHLEIGDARIAQQLAAENLRLRRDIDSLILMARSALAAGDTDGACSARTRVLNTGLEPPEIEAVRAMTMCSGKP